MHVEATDEAGHQGLSDVKVDALERQMSRELQPLTASAEPSLEVTGRVRPEPETVAGGRRQSEPDADRRVVSHVDSR